MRRLSLVPAHTSPGAHVGHTGLLVSCLGEDRTGRRGERRAAIWAGMAGVATLVESRISEAFPRLHQGGCPVAPENFRAVGRSVKAHEEAPETARWARCHLATPRSPEASVSTPGPPACLRTELVLVLGARLQDLLCTCRQGPGPRLLPRRPGGCPLDPSEWTAS